MKKVLFLKLNAEMLKLLSKAGLRSDDYRFVRAYEEYCYERAEGGTAENATYLLALDHFTCGNRKLCTQETFPVSADLKFTPLGSPINVGNGCYCQEVLCSGTCTYMPYVCGYKCNICPRTENIYCIICVPCSSAVTPTLTADIAVASPTNVQPCCSVTNAIAITTTLNVATA